MYIKYLTQLLAWEGSTNINLHPSHVNERHQAFSQLRKKAGKPRCNYKHHSTTAPRWNHTSVIFI